MKEKIGYRLLGIIQELAPNGTAQAKVSNFYNELIKDNLDEKEVATHMAGCLYDGLAYGNWPWN